MITGCAGKTGDALKVIFVRRPTTPASPRATLPVWLPFYCHRQDGWEVTEMTETNMPGFAAKASLFKTRTLYRGYGATGFDMASTVVPADANYDCTNSCLGWADAGAALCVVIAGTVGGPGGSFGCLAADALAAVKCLTACPPPTNGGGGGGGGPQCCPRGTRCSCGGRCVNLKGGGQACTDGVCLGPNQQCP